MLCLEHFHVRPDIKGLFLPFHGKATSIGIWRELPINRKATRYPGAVLIEELRASFKRDVSIFIASLVPLEDLSSCVIRMASMRSIFIPFSAIVFMTVFCRSSMTAIFWIRAYQQRVLSR